METKRCALCLGDVPLDGYNRDAKNADGLHRLCRPCHRDYNRVGRLRAQGVPITIESLRLLLAEHDGTCDLCGRPKGKRSLHLDHDHATGEIRGLLCSWPCNLVVGHLGDQGWKIRAWLRSALAYLDRHEHRVLLREAAPGGQREG